MDWNRVEGSWKQMKGKIKEKWGKLTDDDLNVIDGKQDQLEGKIQERYGYAKDQARREHHHSKAPRLRGFCFQIKPQFPLPLRRFAYLAR